MDGKVVQAPQLGYVPGTYLKKYDDGDQGFLSTMDLKEMLVCVVGHVGGCLDIYIMLMNYRMAQPTQWAPAILDYMKVK